MATIKLGDKILGSIAFGGTKLGDARTLAKNPIFRTQAFKNHRNKQIIYSTPPISVPEEPTTNWLLNNGVWNDTGVWDDTQNWTE